MPDAAEVAAEVVTQARRTADWLGSVPLTRLLADDDRLAGQAYELAVALDDVTRAVCGSAGDGAADECPPADVVPPRLAPHAAGVHVRVFADQFARAVARHGVVRVEVGPLQVVVDQALDLRRGPGQGL